MSQQSSNKRRWKKRSEYYSPNPHQVEKYFEHLANRRIRHKFKNIPAHEMEDVDAEIEPGLLDTWWYEGW